MKKGSHNLQGDSLLKIEIFHFPQSMKFLIFAGKVGIIKKFPLYRKSSCLSSLERQSCKALLFNLASCTTSCPCPLPAAALRRPGVPT